MQSDYAFAKLQSLEGKEFFIRKVLNLLIQIPISAGLSRHESVRTDSIKLSKCESMLEDHFFIGYDGLSKEYYLVPNGPISVDDYSLDSVDKIRSSSDYNHGEKLNLRQLSKIYIPCTDCPIPNLFYFILPTLTETATLAGPNICSSKFSINPYNKVPDKAITHRWSFDEKDQLKKFMLTYGYGRWKRIQKASTSIGGKLIEKPILEVRAFGNSFLRSIAENLSNDCQDLKSFIFGIIEEMPEDPYIAPNPKDWDFSSMKQRSNPWAKRLQLLYRVKILIKKFKEESLKNEENKKKSKFFNNEVPWDTMLNFLPSSVFFGQRPQVWWSKQHDSDLLRGTYVFGYANYHLIKTAPELSFKDGDDTYQEFPSADLITRRLKKLIHIIMKSEQSQGKINFDASSSEDENEWLIEDKKLLFDFLLNFGVPVFPDGKSNWSELRDKFCRDRNLSLKEFDKSVNQFERAVQKLRLECQRIISNDESVENTLEISQNDASKLIQNMNLLHFVRKSILSSSCALFKTGIAEVNLKLLELPDDHPAKMPIEYTPEIHDLSLINCLADNGFDCVNTFNSSSLYGLESFKIDEVKFIARVELICELFKAYVDKNSIIKKTKSNRFSDKDPKKKQKFHVDRDEDGNIIFPIQINNSLKLLALGEISTSPGFHSEHNLFPIGFSTSRMYASMFNKGGRAEYINEILSTDDGKPLYKVTSLEDPSNPIIRDSSTGCWVYICSKVNDISDHKKEKVTISGTERFGLLETNIVRFLESLENSEKCSRYIFKNPRKNLTIDDDQDSD